jgi:hypothetical protein
LKYQIKSGFVSFIMFKFSIMEKFDMLIWKSSSVPDPNPDPNPDSNPDPNPDPPDPHVFGPHGSGSISQRYGSGSGSFYHEANIVRKTLISTVL